MMKGAKMEDHKNETPRPMKGETITTTDIISQPTERRGNPFARRRDPSYFRYYVTFIDSASVALVEYDSGRTSPVPPPRDGQRDPSRTIAVFPVSRLDELEDVAAAWNAENAERKRAEEQEHLEWKAKFYQGVR